MLLIKDKQNNDSSFQFLTDKIKERINSTDQGKQVVKFTPL